MAEGRTTIRLGDGPEIDISGIGSNSGVFDVLGGAASSQLRSLIERVERLNEDKAAVTADIKEVYAEAKGSGFDPAIIRAVIKLRAEDRAKRDERQALIDLYISAIGGI